MSTINNIHVKINLEDLLMVKLGDDFAIPARAYELIDEIGQIARGMWMLHDGQKYLVLRSGNCTANTRIGRQGDHVFLQSLFWFQAGITVSAETYVAALRDPRIRLIPMRGVEVEVSLVYLQ